MVPEAAPQPKGVGMLRCLSLLVCALLSLAVVVSAAITTSLDPTQAPQGTHLQTGSFSCVVNPDLSVTCLTFELAGVGHTDADVALTASYTATVDCFNPGNNRNNPIESHTTSFSATSQITVTSAKNGRLTVPQQSVSPNAVAQGCPNPNWTPTIRPGTLALVSFKYSLVFEDFSSPYIIISGP
jgi:hypothetical protein